MAKIVKVIISNMEYPTNNIARTKFIAKIPVLDSNAYTK